MPKQPELFEHDYSLPWPPQHKFPLNEKSTGARVKDILLGDIRSTTELLIVTGFTSLSHLVEIFGQEDMKGLKRVRVVFGFDIDQRMGKKALHYSLTAEVKNYWAKQDVSLSLCGAVINLIEKIKKGYVQVRMIRHLHAKLYVGDEVAMLGSSNFSKTGIDSTQREANIRVHRNNPKEAEQYASVQQIAENFFAQGKDYNEEFIELLKKLFKDANWEEALARAIAEVLENKWMLDYPVLHKSIMDSELWPTQRIGIARAMKIIQDQGNCLLADPTGSGKTKLGTALLYVIFHWMWENGWKDRSNALIISPKQVTGLWEDARSEFKLINEVVSMGQLSHGSETTWHRIQKILLKTDILLVDEAHNYLNWGTRRSSRMQPKKSAHVVLATATPINKTAEDLLRLIELLDIDNLSEDDLKTFKALYPFRKNKPDAAMLNHLQQYISRFIVRRTKTELNKIIAQSPEHYRNHNKNRCRYPASQPIVYDVPATDDDLVKAEKINALLNGLQGINYLQEWRLPDYLESEGEKRSYIERRFLSAPALAGFKVKSTLRSSRAALYELLYGTGKTASEPLFQLKTGKKHSGELIARLSSLRDTPPRLTFPKEWLPEQAVWMTSEETYKTACDEEIKIYKQIAELALQMTDSRERAKARLLLSEAESAEKVLAFDATLITLDFIYKIIMDEKPAGIELILATGNEESGKKRVIEAFSNECTHNNKKVIALCSDSMSEGINLPAAKTLVLLDVPSVPRIIEQRIGRLERMDSEHDTIRVYWPEDDAPFSLKSDRRLVDTFVITDLLIGSNMQMPEEGSLSRYFAERLDVWGAIEGFKKYVEDDPEWQGVQDTTTLLQSFYDGSPPLIQPATYELYKDVESTVKTAVSFVASDKSWSFFALRGDIRRSAKWLFIENDKATTDFTEITQKLKENLSGSDLVQRRWNDVELSRQFPKLLHFLRKHEGLLLPHKKKRALLVGERLLREAMQRYARESGQEQHQQKIDYLLKWHRGSEDLDAVDMHHFADLWLQILQPALDEKRIQQKRKRKPISLDDLTPEDVPVTNQLLDFLLDEGQAASRIDEVVASCIISLKVA